MFVAFTHSCNYFSTYISRSYIICVLFLLPLMASAINNQVDTTLSLFASSQTAQPIGSSKHKKKRTKHTNPLFVNQSAHTKFNKNKLQTGSIIQIDIRSDVYRMFSAAKWEFFISNLSRKVLPNMVTEFYGNMKLCQGLNGIMYLTSVVCGKPVLLDHLSLSRALKMDPNLLSLPNIDISSNFVFNKDECKLFMSVFCGNEVSHNVVSEKGCHLEYFSPSSQVLALIVRSNVFPAFDKLVSFSEMKLMYKLMTHGIHFNPAYMMLMKMYACSQMGHMPYAMFLTPIFEFLGLSTNQPPMFHITTTISEKSKRTSIPLGYSSSSAGQSSSQVGLGTHSISIGPAPSLESKEFKGFCDKMKTLELEFDSFRKVFLSSNLKVEQLVGKLDVLMGMLNATIARVNALEIGISQVIQMQVNLSSPPMFFAPFNAPVLENLGSDLDRTADVGSDDDVVIIGSVPCPAVIPEVQEEAVEGANAPVVVKEEGENAPVVEG